jgi:hypothetical protein
MFFYRYFFLFLLYFFLFFLIDNNFSAECIYNVLFSFFPAKTPVKCSIFCVLELADGKHQSVILHNNRGYAFSDIIDFSNYFKIEVNDLLLEYFNHIFNKKKSINVKKIIAAILIPTNDLETKIAIYKAINNQFNFHAESILIVSQGTLYTITNFLLKYNNFKYEKKTKEYVNTKCNTLLFLNHLVIKDLNPLLNPFLLRKDTIFLKKCSNELGKIYSVKSDFNMLILIIAKIVEYTQN